MMLVERFIEINGWPISRKTALLAGLALPAHLINWWVTHAALAASTVADVALLDTIYVYGTVVLGTGLAISLLLTRLGHDARWLPYVFVLAYGMFLGTLLYAMGLWSTIWFSIVPITVLMAALYFGERLGWFTFVASLVVIGGFGVLQATGVLAYAPGLLDRSFDVQQSPVWILSTVMPVLAAYLFAFCLCLLSVAAQNLQGARLRDAQTLIRRYVPSQVADAIIAGRAGSTARHERRKLTIFFSDLLGFTDISEELEPEDLSRVLNEYFSEMTGIAQKHGGTVDELSGDAILILFGAPQATSDKDHALRAVRMASEMQQTMAGLNDRWSKAGITETLQVRMGINTGVVTIGDFGSKDRMKYAALGKHVNLAARIQTHCEPGKVLISHATWLLVNDQVQGTPKGEREFKGINKPVPIYELT
jgi:adenylate cyclase